MQPKNNEKEKQKYKRDKAWANLPREEQPGKSKKKKGRKEKKSIDKQAHGLYNEKAD